MNFEQAKATQARLKADVDRLSEMVRNFPGHGTGLMGLTPDDVRAQPGV